jgi:hypothetical protein
MEDDFMTLGIAVECTSLKDPKNPKEELKSGTSYATPIAAAIAAQILYVTECLMDVNPTALKCLRTRKGMRKMFELMCEDKDTSGYRFLAPWVQFWPEGRHDKSSKIKRVEGIINDTTEFKYISSEETDALGEKWTRKQDPVG